MDAPRSSRIVLSAVDTTSVSSAAISEPSPASTTVHVRTDLEFMQVQTPPAGRIDRLVSGGYVVLTGDGSPAADGRHPRPRARGRRGGVPGTHRPPPARAPTPLLPNPWVRSGCRGPASGDALGSLART